MLFQGTVLKLYQCARVQTHWGVPDFFQKGFSISTASLNHYYLVGGGWGFASLLLHFPCKTKHSGGSRHARTMLAPCSHHACTMLAPGRAWGEGSRCGTRPPIRNAHQLLGRAWGDLGARTLTDPQRASVVGVYMGGSRCGVRPPIINIVGNKFLVHSTFHFSTFHLYFSLLSAFHSLPFH